MTDPVSQTPAPDGPTVDQVASLINGIDAGGFYALAAAFDRARDRLSQVNDGFRAANRTALERWAGSSADAFDGLSRQVEANTADQLHVLRDPGHGALLRKAGDAVSDSQARMRVLLRARAEQPGVAGEQAARPEAWRILNELEQVYLDTGRALARPPGEGGTTTSGGGGGSASGGSPVSVDPPPAGSITSQENPTAHAGGGGGAGGVIYTLLGGGRGYGQATGGGGAGGIVVRTVTTSTGEDFPAAESAVPFGWVMGRTTTGDGHRPGAGSPVANGTGQRGGSGTGSPETFGLFTSDPDGFFSGSGAPGHLPLGKSGGYGTDSRPGGSGRSGSGDEESTGDVVAATGAVTGLSVIGTDKAGSGRTPTRSAERIRTAGGEVNAPAGATEPTSNRQAANPQTVSSSASGSASTTLPVRQLPSELASVQGGPGSAASSGGPLESKQVRPSTGAGGAGHPGYGMGPMSGGAGAPQNQGGYRSVTELTEHRDLWRGGADPNGVLGRPEPTLAEDDSRDDTQRYLGDLSKLLDEKGEGR
ncbi:WXG100 family type VII secretion target [Amycolatopsis sp. cmx-4-54]|uniref:WXG100 family type VII secretion target n=1 Tax=Amycolatopsis sp. cmx-4-54 TaxID=2790936 RepID=UPI003978C9F8